MAALGMAMLANEELMFVTPKIDTKQNEFKPIGYYTDDYGVRRFGVIPQKQQYNFNMKIEVEKRDVDSYYGYERLRVSSY